MAGPVFLYVDDDALSCEVMQMLLIDLLGFSELNVFKDSSNFIARLEALPAKPDVIFLDIHMAPHDGFALLKMIRCHDEFRDVAVVALTASVMSEEVRKLKTAGFDGVVGKPIKQQTFPELLNRILHGEQVWYVS